MTTVVEKSDEKPGAVPLAQLPGVLFGRRWRIPTIIVILGMLFLARLGVWQLDRLEQRRAANALLEAQFNSEVIDLNAGTPTGDLVDRRAVVTGRFDYDEQFILKEQSYNGRPGVHLVTPFVIDGRSEAVLVDRGWIAAADADLAGLSQFDGMEEGQIEGVLQKSQTLSGNRETIVESDQREWYRIDIEAIESVSSYELVPVYLLQSAEGEDGTLPIREDYVLDLSEGSHLGYAVQWFLFALTLGVGYSRYVSTHDKGAD